MEIKLNSVIEHTLLNPKAKLKDLRKLCNEAQFDNFRAVVVNPEWVNYCKQQLEGTSIKVVQVYNFPTSQSELLQGDEVDVYVKLNGISRNNYTKEMGKLIIHSTVKGLVKEGVHKKNIKIVIETRLLSDKDVLIASKFCANEKVGCIKSSTGLYKRINGRTNLQDLELIKRGIRFCTYKPKIKIAGGISTMKDVNELTCKGADLIGSSKGPNICKVMD